MTHQIAKILSANDTGETGCNQSGILIPKDEQFLSFFPRLDPAQRNPRSLLNFVDDGGAFWEFAFIYYNNKFFGGTCNEYRLTRMTKYIRQANLSSGDELILTRSIDGQYTVGAKRQKAAEVRPGPLRLGSQWRVVKI